MARTRPVTRIDELADTAARVFTTRGYRRTQMADVARAVGLAPGTLYLYVASKEALFDLVVQRAFRDGEPPPPPPLLQRLTEYLERRMRQQQLRRAPHPAAAARFIVETVAWFAMHRHHDLDSTMIDDTAAEETAVDAVVSAFAKE